MDLIYIAQNILNDDILWPVVEKIKKPVFTFHFTYEDESEKTMCENRDDGYTTLCYKPGQKNYFYSKTGKLYNGTCSSSSNNWFFWPIKHDNSKDINEIIDSIIYIFFPANYKIRQPGCNYGRAEHEIFFMAVVMHEFLHSIGFGHAKEGIMVESLGQCNYDIDIWIDDNQYNNWWTEAMD